MLEPLRALRMVGTYHQFGAYVSGVASLPRVVIMTMHDISLKPRGANGQDKNFIPGPNGFPQVVMANGTLVEGNPVAPVKVTDDLSLPGNAYRIAVAGVDRQEALRRGDRLVVIGSDVIAERAHQLGTACPR